ncbi:MAG: hypothetical protein R3B96_03750 [Pirellulaceae bacterium]
MSRLAWRLAERSRSECGPHRAAELVAARGGGRRATAFAVLLQARRMVASNP